MNSKTEPTPGPWATPATSVPTAAELRAGIDSALWAKRTLLYAQEINEWGRHRRYYSKRLKQYAKDEADIGLLSSLKAREAQDEELLTRCRTEREHSARTLLGLLSSLEPYLDIHQAGAVLGIHHQHIERAGGLLHAALEEPTPSWISIPLHMAIFDRIKSDPILDRAMTEKLNEILDVDFPLPPRPRPKLATPS